MEEEKKEEQKEQEDKQEYKIKRELAVITQLIYGYSEQGVGMVFNLQLLDGATTLFMEVSAVTQLLTETKIANIMLLQNRPCSVNITSDKVVSFDKLI